MQLECELLLLLFQAWEDSWKCMQIVYVDWVKFEKYLITIFSLYDWSYEIVT